MIEISGHNEGFENMSGRSPEANWVSSAVATLTSKIRSGLAIAVLGIGANSCDGQFNDRASGDGFSGDSFSEVEVMEENEVVLKSLAIGVKPGESSFSVSGFAEVPGVLPVEVVRAGGGSVSTTIRIEKDGFVNIRIGMLRDLATEEPLKDGDKVRVGSMPWGMEVLVSEYEL